jgi:DNA-binding beta-propeller fold protein YncE
MAKRFTACIALILLASGPRHLRSSATEPETPAPSESRQEFRLDRSPVDLVLTPDEKWLLTANQTSDSVSLVRLSNGLAVSEIACGKHPAAIALTPDGRRALVSATYSGQLHVLAIDGEHLRAAGSIRLGFEPRGIAVSPDGKLAYVALTAANMVAAVDLDRLKVTARIAVGRWPRTLALTRDGTRLAVGASGDGGISVVDTQACVKLYDSKFVGLNIGHLQASADGKFAYFPWMVYADRPITSGNIREGWVLGNRVARIRLDGPARREALALDPRGRAVADPHGIALSPDERWLVMSAGGTHELVVFRLTDLPLREDGPGDHLKGEIASDSDRFFRIPLGGRPLGLRFDRAGERVFVANYLANAVQIVSLADRRVERTIELGGPTEPSLARRGEAIFYDAMRSADGWYSCHSCHYEGDTNAVTMDTKNDGSFGTYKMVLSLRNSRHTGPWFWHGRANDFHAALRKSLTDTMQGPAPTDDDVAALATFLEAMPLPESSHRQGSELSAEALRGKKVFDGAEAGCAACHRGPYLTDGEIHDVGLGSEHDVYRGFNTPSLLGIGNRVRYLHHGRAESLDDLLTDLHSPAKVSGTRELTSEERADLIAYLRSL